MRQQPAGQGSDSLQTHSWPHSGPPWHAQWDATGRSGPGRFLSLQHTGYSESSQMLSTQDWRDGCSTKSTPRTAKEQSQHPNTSIVTWIFAELTLTQKPTALKILQLGINCATSELVHPATCTANYKKHLQFKALTDSRSEFSHFKSSPCMQNPKCGFWQIDFLESISG